MDPACQLASEHAVSSGSHLELTFTHYVRFQKKLQQKHEAHGLKMGLHSPVGDVLLALSMFCSAFGVDHRIILHI